MPAEDQFSQQAALYARARPHYPETFYGYLASLAPAHDVAWDCGTGSGQAALGTAAHFRRVVATDMSHSQLAHAFAHPRVRYAVALAEHCPLRSASADLVTVSQAAHWFDHDRFHAEVRRVLRPGGVVALWTYFLPDVTPAVNALWQRFYAEVAGPYWSAGVRYVEAAYETLPFPFREVRPPAFTVTAHWTADDAFDFFNSWSATQKIIAATGENPFVRGGDLYRAFAAAWGDAARRVTWPLIARVGTVGTVGRRTS